MTTDSMSTELIAALTRAETEFSLSDIFQQGGVSKNEPITVKFKFDNETLFVSQRLVDPANVRISWEPFDGQSIESYADRQTGQDIGREVAKIFSAADVLSTFKTVLQGRNVNISIEHPVVVEIISARGFHLTSLKCPCSNQPCCQV